MIGLENGFTKIANELLEIVPKYKFNGTQIRLLLVIWRYTYGFNRKEHDFSLSFLLEALGLEKNQLKQVKREINNLISANVIIEVRKPTENSPRRLAFNKNYLQWTIQTSGQIRPLDKLDPCEGTKKTSQPLDKLDPQERNIKEKYKEKYNSVFETYINQEIINHRTITKVMKQAIDQSLKKYALKEIITAIERYGQAYRDSAYEYCKYQMTLDKFLTQKNGMYDWLDEGQKWINYSSFKDKSKADEINDIYNVNGR